MKPETVPVLKAFCASLFQVDPASGDVAGCLCCKWILEDLEANGDLTDGKNLRPSEPGKALFPKIAKLWHLELELRAARKDIPL